MTMISDWNLNLKENERIDDLLAGGLKIIQNNKEYIFEVWDEEDNEVTQKRYELFLQGAHKFLDNI